MRFFTGYFLKGPVLSLYGMLRTFIGGAALALFIMKSYGLPGNARETLERLRGYTDIAEGFVIKIDPTLAFMVIPWQDYVASQRVFIKIIELLIENEFPQSCEFYWPEPQ